MTKERNAFGAATCAVMPSASYARATKSVAASNSSTFRAGYAEGHAGTHFQLSSKCQLALLENDQTLADNQFRIARGELHGNSLASFLRNAGVRCGLISGLNRVAKRLRSWGGSAAFTLIELALSIFVMGVAVLGVFGLARIGVSTAMEAEDEMRAAQFADDVFTTLRLYSDAFQDTNRWDSFEGELATWTDGLTVSNNLFYAFWTKLSENEDVDFICLPDFWDAPENGGPLGSVPDETPYPIRMQVVGPDDYYDDIITTNIFCAANIRGLEESTILPEYAIRYRLVIVTNSTSYVSANMNVWCGLDSRRRNDYTFYTHFFERRNLP